MNTLVLFSATFSNKSSGAFLCQQCNKWQQLNPFIANRTALFRGQPQYQKWHQIRVYVPPFSPSFPSPRKDWIVSWGCHCGVYKFDAPCSTLVQSSFQRCWLCMEEGSRKARRVAHMSLSSQQIIFRPNFMSYWAKIKALQWTRATFLRRNFLP